MENSVDESNGTRSTDSYPVNRSETMLSTTGPQVNKRMKRASESTIGASDEPVASTHSGATQDLLSCSLGERSSLPGNSTGYQFQQPLVNVERQLKTDKDAPPEKQSKTSFSVLYIDVLQDFGQSSNNTNISLSNKQQKAEYSRDGDRKLLGDVLKPEYSPHVEIRPKMLHGYKDTTQTKKPSSHGHRFSIALFLEYLKFHKDLLDPKNAPNFVSTIGTIKRLMCVCYEPYSKWEVYAKKQDGIWYLSEGWSDGNDGVDNKDKYAGRMFELLMTGKETAEEAAQQAKRDFLKHPQTYKVWEACLVGHRLLYSGEVDCWEKKDEEKTIELKTYAWKEKPFDKNERKVDMNTFRRYWAQSHLMGDKNIAVGFLNKTKPEYELIEVKKYETDMPLDASAKWQRENCFACLNHILCQFNDNFFEDAATYVLMFKPGAKEIEARKSEINLDLG